MAQQILAGRCILIVEDEFLLAESLREMIAGCGADVLGPVGCIAEALESIKVHAQRLDGVVLDLNLHGERTYVVADRLADLSIRFVFATGYSADAIDPAYLHYPRCEKPVEQTMIIAALVAT